MKPETIHRLFAALFFILLAALLVLTYYPNLPEVKIRIRNEWLRMDYIGHFGFYTALTASFLIWRAGWRKRIKGRMLFGVIFAGILLGICMEISQSLVPGRTFNPFDMAYNCLGVITGVIAVYLFAKPGAKPA